MSLFIIGSSNTDLVLYMDHIPKIGETIVGAESLVVFGGKGANQAVSAKRAGADARFITQLGGDSFGDQLKLHFEKESLPSSYIITDPNTPSGIAQIFVSKKGENSIAVASGSNGTLYYTKIKPFLSEIAIADLILLQLEIPFETVKKLILFSHQKNIKIILNPAPGIFLSKVLLQKIWMITPNESEAEILTNVKVISEKSAINAAKKIVKQGVVHCIVTLGEKGSIWCYENSLYRFTIPKVNAIDSTAAGDVFNGYLAQGITEGKSLKDAILIAHAASCLSVTIKGAQTSIPSKKNTMSFLKKNKGFLIEKLE